MLNKPLLYYSPRSGPCRAVLLTAAEIGIDLDLHHMSLQNGEHRTPEFLKINPQHTIPVLDDNGTIITDSHVICMYLADKYSNDKHLYPRDLEARNRVLARLFFSCGNLAARVKMITEPVVWFGSTELSKKAIEYVKKSYDPLENCLKDHPYVCGQYMTIADLCCIATMSTANDFAPVDEKLFPNVVAWMERMSQLPYYKRCNRDGADIMKKSVMSKLETNRKTSG